MDEKKTDTVDIHEACRILGISRATLYNRMNEGRIAPLRRNSVQDRTRLAFDRATVERLAQPRPHTKHGLVRAE